MKPVKQPPMGGLIISTLVSFWLIIVSIVLAFNAASFLGWVGAAAPFTLAGVILWRMERTIRHYQDYCLWLEEQHMAAAQEREEISMVFDAVLREHYRAHPEDFDIRELPGFEDL